MTCVMEQTFRDDDDDDDELTAFCLVLIITMNMQSLFMRLVVKLEDYNSPRVSHGDVTITV